MAGQIRSSKPPGVDYGIDAPTLVIRFFTFGIIAIACGLGAFLAPQHGPFRWLHFFSASIVSIGAFYFATAATMLWGSKFGKFRIRDRVIDSIPWRGDETVLDVGCGHGLMLIGAAKHLRTGSAIGIDLWQSVDQSGNSRNATMRNVELEGVAAVVTVKDGDARKMDFPDESFDVVLSSWAIHNIPDSAGRETSIREIVRVLKPGGRLVIVDIQQTQQYARVLADCGLANIKRSGPNFLFVIPTFTLKAQKSA